MRLPQNGWFIREHTIKIADLGVPPFLETSIFFNSHFRNLNWRYLPTTHTHIYINKYKYTHTHIYIYRYSLYKAYVREYPDKIWPEK